MTSPASQPSPTPAPAPDPGNPEPRPDTTEDPEKGRVPPINRPGDLEHPKQ